MHTHYDGQIFWDPYCTMSGWHGITSVVVGNCGFSFAPVRPEMRDRAMLMLSRTEAIELEALQEGMPWDWVTFPEYLDSLDRQAKGVNVTSYCGVSPLMMWVMGLEAGKGANGDGRRDRADVRPSRRGTGGGEPAGGLHSGQGMTAVSATTTGTSMLSDLMSVEQAHGFSEVLARSPHGVDADQRPRGEPPIHGDLG